MPLPLNQSSDILGQPLPNATHAVSVCLPRWRDVVGYEEGDPAVTRAISSGYPRFVLHPLVLACRDLLASKAHVQAEDCWIWPNLAVANRCLAFAKQSGWHGRLVKVYATGIALTEVWPGPGSRPDNPARAFWQHTGEIVSSRQAEAILLGLNQPIEDQDAILTIKERVARLANVSTEDIYLFPTGMAAIYAIWRALGKYRPGSATVQFGFPYVDTLKIQKLFGRSVHFFPQSNEHTHQNLLDLIRSHQLSGIFTEVPSNPLLNTPQLKKIAKACRARKVPLIVDNTLDSFANLAFHGTADVVICSLTKSFAGTGDVMAGAVILHRDSPCYGKLRDTLQADTAPALWQDDAIALAESSKDVSSRLRTVNQNAAEIAAWLHKHPQVKKLYFPRTIDPDAFRSLCKNNPVGWGSLLSLELHGGEQAAKRFYDNLDIAKGPSLGTNFSLICPYTLLAHYHERDWAKTCGISPWLLRLSVGLEPAHQTIGQLNAAMTCLENRDR